MSKITILDSNDIANPESRAVLQALVSRSVTHINDLKERVNENKTQGFISLNCIGYGHDAVLENADSIVINLHGISMLAAKAIEDTSKFRGTEASTRYIDITSLPLHAGVPENHPEYDRRYGIIKTQIDFFKEKFNDARVYMQAKYPFEYLFELNNTLSTATYDKAINARTFDIMRSFLPSGASTIVNWTTDIRTLKDRLTELLGHHLKEVRDLAKDITAQAFTRYPASFAKFPDMGVVNHILDHSFEYHAFEENPVFGPADIWEDEALKYQKFDIAYTEKEIEEIEYHYPSLSTRPRGVPLPRIYASRFNVSGLMDFGSFRDIQRHRNGMCKIPLLSTRFGFENWYLDQLPEELKNEANDFIYTVEDCIGSNENTVVEDQYMIPFGYRLPYVLDYSLEQMVYVAELRSSRYVHPTCRVTAQGITRFLDQKFPFIEIYPDRDLNDFDAKRGNHSIVGV